MGPQVRNRKNKHNRNVIAIYLPGSLKDGPRISIPKLLGSVYGVSTMTHVRRGGEGARGGEGEERSHIRSLSNNIVYKEKGP